MVVGFVAMWPSSIFNLSTVHVGVYYIFDVPSSDRLFVIF